jgi:hypothetical protein
MHLTAPALGSSKTMGSGHFFHRLQNETIIIENSALHELISQSAVNRQSDFVFFIKQIITRTIVTITTTIIDKIPK